jgi:hypothetical protein
MTQVSGKRRLAALPILLSLFVLSPALSLAQNSKPAAKSPARSAAHTSAASSEPFHEDLTTLTLEHSSFLKKVPTLAERDDIPGTSFIRERYNVEWRPSDPFDLYVIRPRGVPTAPVVLYLYSFPDDTENFKDNHWCEAVTSNGYAAVGFVSALTGHRTRYRLLKESLVSEMPEALVTTTHDVQLILDYLSMRADLDAHRIGMFGLGSGGSIAILASAVDPRIRVLDVLSPWADWKEWFGSAKIVPDEDRATFLKPEFLSKVAPLDPVVWLPKAKARSIRIQDVRMNSAMPDEAQEKLEAAAPSFAIIDQYGNGRAYLTNQPPVLIFQWVKEQLKPGTKPQVAVEKSQRIHFYPAIQAAAQSWPNVGAPNTDKPQTIAKEKDKPKEKDNP